MKINNRIIALSGEPVSGKSAVTKRLVDKLQEIGYSQENIHIISTGNQFRHFFEKIISFIANIGDEEIIKELAREPQMQQILNNQEYREALATTIARVQKQNIDLEGLKNISQANNNRVFLEIRSAIDSIIDNETRRMGKEINEKERKDEIWIFDSRVAFSMVPDAFSVRLTTNPREAARRVFNDKSRGTEDKYETLEQAEKAREERRLGEIKRYKAIYGVDLSDEENYDLIIDTAYASVEDEADVILACEEEYKDGRHFGKHWASPLTMLPTQPYTTTYRDLKYFTDEIRKNGFDPSDEIETFKIDGINFISDGHHRNFGSIQAGKTLIPYRDCKENNIHICEDRFLWDHEPLIEEALREQKGDETVVFSYNDIYPGISKKIRQIQNILHNEDGDR